MSTGLNDPNRCEWCRNFHAGVCPAVKAFDYYPDGTIKRVEGAPARSLMPDQDKTMSGRKIIDGLKDAVAGNFSRVTIEGRTWVRSDSGPLVGQLADAHAEIARLTAEVERLRAALKPFWVYYQVNDLDKREADDAIEVPVGDLRIAHRAFEQSMKENKT